MCESVVCGVLGVLVWCVLCFVVVFVCVFLFYQTVCVQLCALYNAMLYGRSMLCLVVCGCVLVLLPCVCFDCDVLCYVGCVVVLCFVCACACMRVLLRCVVCVGVCLFRFVVSFLCVVCDVKCDVVWRVFNVLLVCVGV